MIDWRRVESKFQPVNPSENLYVQCLRSVENRTIYCKDLQWYIRRIFRVLFNDDGTFFITHVGRYLSIGWSRVYNRALIDVDVMSDIVSFPKLYSIDGDGWQTVEVWWGVNRWLLGEMTYLCYRTEVSTHESESVVDSKRVT